jgi:thiol-disulfide isomerase/thioredoxin
MRTTCRLAVAAFSLALTLRAGVADAQQQPSPRPAAPAAAAQPAKLRINEVIDRPLTWPDEVALKRSMMGDSGEIKAGTKFRVYNANNQGVFVELPKTKELTGFPFDATDFLEKANERYAALPEDAKNLTWTGLVDRPGLLPTTIKLTEDVQFQDKNRKSGSDIGPYRVIKTAQGPQLIAIDPDMVKDGVLNTRQTYFPEATDFVRQLKAQFQPKDSSAARQLRIVEEIKGKLVDASGKPLADADKPAKFYAVYSSAGWCGWCSKFNPELAKFYDEAKQNNWDVEVIYLSQDKSEKEMVDHLTQTKTKYPAVKFDERLKTPYMLGLISGATPHLIIVTADGRLVHDGVPNGYNGAQAALAKLRAELVAGSRSKQGS